MKHQPGDTITSFSLPAIDGSLFDLESLKGKRYLLSFFRYASCPFCNLRLHELVTRYQELDNAFTIVAVFDSSLENLQRHAQKHHAPFTILADQDNACFKLYEIEHSLPGMLKSMIVRLPALLDAMILKGYIPWRIKGSITRMPADFLIDENGVIQTAYYGKDAGDHLAFSQIKAFALG
jgi:peroxiredoxin